MLYWYPLDFYTQRLIVIPVYVYLISSTVFASKHYAMLERILVECYALLARGRVRTHN